MSCVGNAPWLYDSPGYARRLVTVVTSNITVDVHV